MLRLGNSFVQNPHEVYDRLRRSGPVQRVEMWGGVPVWLVTRYQEARNLLTDPRIGKDGAAASALFPPGTDGSIGTVLGDNMLFRDPPDHTRLRRFVTSAFTAHAVRRLRPTIAGFADALLDDIAASVPGQVDLLQAFAQPLPVQVIGELLGVPERDRELFAALVVPIFTSTDTTVLRRAQKELTLLLTDMLAEKRQSPADDVLSSLVHRRDGTDQLSEAELLGTAFLLIVAGYETTVNLLANGILALLRNPEQLRAVRADRSLLPRAVEEALRFESPLNTATVRYTSAPVTVGDVEIPAGELVVIGLLAANHDDKQFPDAHRFDVSRTHNRHLAFGYGVHHCVGAPLARMEAEIGFDRLLSRFEVMELVDSGPPRYRPSTLMRGVERLPVILGYPHDIASTMREWSGSLPSSGEADSSFAH
ncbi:cytochrome P450 [Mycolicibacterium smegmatis]|uniref:cytochrome P450 family protein n=1 Tax=Mycolicibacterium smegmatis TaxID=1772 RepID=UPI0005D747FA|nr:cytochrome P450 [Mycolicibacterium smegmatis]MDF1905349.1 cytochrome P450 [Mycolicibacterium smegmatis]MDF1915955.1 cytochrome P450 [Mycolicibacterium smegmatis]MDF1923561.1 cytochrome P450 [Mycolicibacterium smegmatis]UAK55091.1 cytochrome P450 [Mycolicibacterium smegmatis]UGT76164.1 cytochrome P450 [Mycolicibacterium smegmatis]